MRQKRIVTEKSDSELAAVYQDRSADIPQADGQHEAGTETLKYSDIHDSKESPDAKMSSEKEIQLKRSFEE